MSIGIYGSSNLTLDTKGRIVIPARYRELLRASCEGEMIITKDPQYPALIIYPGKLWKEISQKFEALGGLNQKVRSIQWKILGNASGDLGSVGFTLGIASPLNNLITQLLADDGLIDAKLDGLSSSVADITSQREALALRADALEKRYRNQFNGLETLISQLNTTQSFLTTALSQFVKPLAFKK